MSLSNRFNHPFERWMNNIWRRESEQWRRPGSSSKSSGSKGSSSKSLGRKSDSYGQSMAPWGYGSGYGPQSASGSRWMEPWSHMGYGGEAREPWFSEGFSPMANMDFNWPHLHSQSHTNEQGELVFKAKLPDGIEQDDIHLDFEEGCLKLHATKAHEESRKVTVLRIRPLTRLMFLCLTIGLSRKVSLRRISKHTTMKRKACLKSLSPNHTNSPNVLKPAQFPLTPERASNTIINRWIMNKLLWI